MSLIHTLPSGPLDVVGDIHGELSALRDLLRHLAKYKRYPEDARRRGLQGINRLRFVVDAEGKVVSYSMAGGSGSAALDRATLEMIRRAGTVPKPPPELLNNGTIEVVAPFVYSLDRR